MICPRHRLMARFEEHGRAYCGKCFAEAALFAREMTMRRTSADCKADCEASREP